MAEVFRDAGYATGMFGKWHLGDNYPFRPEDRGFGEVMRHGGGTIGETSDYWDNAYFDDTYFHNGKRELVKGYCTDVWFDYARRFVKEQKKAGKPFLAYISTNAPHWPMHSPPELAAPYEERLGVRVGHFFGMIANIDDNVGRLRAFLEQEGLTENTIFIFTTDNDDELYDIKQDPGQENNVAADHPKVVARLRAFYDAWWAELEPTFQEAPAIYLGHEREDPTRLTSHDWVVPDKAAWNQALVRAALSKSTKSGYWNVKVIEAGEYEILLRRWPKEVDVAIDAPLPPGDDVPGESPFRATPGDAVPAVKATVQIGEMTAEVPVEPGAKEVVLQMTLPAGKTRMTARFTTRSGHAVGAFYAYVKKR